MLDRRRFLGNTIRGVASLPLWWPTASHLFAQAPGERPQADGSIKVLNPRTRVPIGIIVDDSTCLVNLNRFAMPQFNEAWQGTKPVYHRDWKSWPAEIPDSFVRRFIDWAAENDVKGKYSIVPFPACVGRLDSEVPGWSRREIRDSIDLVRKHIMPNWDIHPEMITHTRVIDLKTGHPLAGYTSREMENWEWTRGRSADELTDYIAYALQILKNVDLPCTGITTPGGFGKNARDNMGLAAMRATRAVMGEELPHYFTDVESSGNASVAPRVMLAKNLDTDSPECVVSVLGCTGDWTGGWNCVDPKGADAFITEDLKAGRLVDVIERGEPAMLLCHWTGVYFNGYELGFQVFQEVFKRLKQRYDNLLSMKMSEVARYWAARELTRCELAGNVVKLKAPYACDSFTIEVPAPPGELRPIVRAGDKTWPLKEVAKPLLLENQTFVRDASKPRITLCFSLPKGSSEVRLANP